MWEFRVYQYNQGGYVVERRNRDGQWERVEAASNPVEAGDLVTDVLEGNLALGDGGADDAAAPPEAA